MKSPVSMKMGVVGVGVIGRGWMKVFARAGCSVAVYDSDVTQAKRAIEWFARDLQTGVALGSLTPQDAEHQLSLVSHESLGSGFREVEYVQESGPENLAVKRQIMRDLDRAVGPSAIIGSSTSALDVNEFVTDLPGAHRIVTAHPINPAYLHPALEVFPSRQASSETVDRALAILRAVGMKPVLMRKFINGYISARVQSALMREAMYLVQQGVTTVDGVDTMVRDGLGQRWAFLGPFGVNHTNADGGVREYYNRFRQTYLEIMADLDNSIPPFDQQMIEQIAKQVDTMTRGATVGELTRWRDEVVTKLREIKVANPTPGDVRP